MGNENCKNDEGNERKMLQSHKTIANFAKKSDKFKHEINGLKINKMIETENQNKHEENEKKSTFDKKENFYF
jgi:hypothetical protein